MSDRQSLIFTLLAGEKSVHRGRELIPSIEELQFQNKDESHELSAHFPDQLSGSVGRAASCDNVIDNDNLLARLDGVGLHLEKVLAVLLLVALGLTRAGQLALLANRDKASAKPQGQAGAEKEPSSLQSNDNIGLLVTVGFEDVQFKATEESFVQGRIGEDRKDILEENARRREVGELAQSGAESYFKTGEFGGAGGMGGGVSGDLGGGGIWSLRGLREI